MEKLNKISLLLFFLLTIINSFGQHKEASYKDVFAISPEFQFGLTLPSNTNFPSRKIQTALQLNISKKNYSSSKKWASLLNYPTTGVGISYTNFGNVDKLGKAISVTPFFEYNFKRHKLEKISLKTGFGISYLNKLHDPYTNPFNKAASVHFNVNYYLLMNYQLTLNKRFPIKIGGGYIHHSNGHSKLPNLGFNSALITVSSDIFSSNRKKETNEKIDPIPRSFQTYFEIKNGMGFNDFLEENDVNKNVWTYAASGGLIYKDTYKIGLGLSYRRYQHYYDYIVANQLADFSEKPNKYASNIFLFINTELLLNHVGLNIDGGLNLYKPFYETHYLLLEDGLDFKYELKKLFLGRMGLKLYVNNTSNLPDNNIYLGAHINANLSQADFFEFSVGYVHRLPLKKWKMKEWNKFD